VRSGNALLFSGIFSDLCRTVLPKPITIGAEWDLFPLALLLLYCCWYFYTNYWCEKQTDKEENRTERQLETKRNVNAASHNNKRIVAATTRVCVLLHVKSKEEI